MNLHYDGEIQIKKIEVGSFENNAYFLIDPDTKESLGREEVKVGKPARFRCISCPPWGPCTADTPA